MINFSIQHSLDDLIKGQNINYSYVGCYIDNSVILVSKENSITKLFRFHSIPPSISTIYEGEIDTDIFNIIISPNKRILSFTDRKNIYFIDLLNPNSKIISLQNCTKCAPIFSTDKETYYIFERNSILYQTTVQTQKDQISLKSSRGSSILKNIIWWSVKLHSKVVAVLTESNTERKIHIYLFQDKLIEIFVYQMPSSFDNVLPSHFFLINSRILVVACVTDTGVLIASYPSFKTNCIPYSHNENVTISMNNNILVVNVPGYIVALVDSDGGRLTTKIIEKQELLCKHTPKTLVQSSLKSDLFFDTEKMAFLNLEVDWNQLSNLINSDDILTWHFVAHLTAAHATVSFFTQDIIKTIPKNFPFGIIHYFLEYCVSGVYQWLSPDTPSIFFSFLPPIINISSIMEQEPTEKEILHALHQTDVFLIPPSILTRTPLWNELIKLNKDFCPYGFWKISTIILLLLFYLGAREHKSKFMEPLASFSFPLLDPPEMTNDIIKQVREVRGEQILAFLSDYVKKLCAISQALPAPSSDAKPIEKLRYEATLFASAHRFHLPYNVHRLPNLDSLLLSETPIQMQYILSRNGIIQTEKSYEGRPDLWIRSQSDLAAFQHRYEKLRRSSKDVLTKTGRNKSGYFYSLSKPPPSAVEYLGPSEAKVKIEVRKKDETFSAFLPYQLACERYSTNEDDNSLENTINSLSKRYSITELEKIYL